MDEEILKCLYKRKNDGQFYDVSALLNIKKPKIEIDNYVIELERNGYVIKNVKGRVGHRASPIGEDQSDTNNSKCKITPKGIVYIENIVNTKANRLISILAIIISLIAIIFSALQFF